MIRTPFAAAAVIAAAGALILIPQQALANGCLQAPVWDAATNTYTITTATQLRTLSQGACDMTATIRLANDIDLTGTGEFTPIGTNGDRFSGTFDGGGHSITGLQVTSPSASGYGLFGFTLGATMRDVSVTGTVLSETQSSGGLLVGNATNTTISGVRANGTVTSVNGAGALVGFMGGGMVSDSSASAVVSASGPSGVAGVLIGYGLANGVTGRTITRVHTAGSAASEGHAGGLVGYLSGMQISQASSTAIVRGKWVGGLAGTAIADATGASITDAFSTGEVMGSAAAEGMGGIVGITCAASPVGLERTYFTGTLRAEPGSSPRTGGIVGSAELCNSSFSASATAGNVWNSDTVGGAGTGSGVGTSATTAQMKQLATYTAIGWSIVNGWEPAGSSPWGICPQVNEGYPFLQYTGAGSACKAPAAVPAAATPALLQASVLPSRRRVVSGQALRMGIRARNTGGSAATSVVSCVRLPATLVLVRAPGAVRSGRVACFRLGTLATGAQATRTITARAVTLRRASVTVTASATASGLSRVSATPVTVTVVPRAARARVTG